MKINKLFLIGAIAIGMVACKSEGPEVANPEGSTFAGLSLTVNKGGTRAVSQNDNVGKPVENTIATIDLFSTAGNKTWSESNAATPDWGTATAPGTKFWSDGNADKPVYTVAPWLTEPGAQTMALVLNNPTGLAPAAATAADEVYGAGTADAAANNATIKALSTADKFVMTSPAFAGVVLANKSFDVVKGGTDATNNVFNTEVERVVCQGIVKQNATLSNAVGTLGTVDMSYLRFSAANGATKTYLFKSHAGSRTMETTAPYWYKDYVSVIDYVSSDADVAIKAPELFRLGNDAETLYGKTSPYAAIDVNPSTVDLKTDAKGIYFLENSMPAPADHMTWNYNRNAYAKVYTVFTPTKVWDIVGGKLVYVNWADRSTKDADENSNSFFKGEMDGQLYVTSAAAKLSVTAKDQKSYMYKDGKTVYRVLWNRQATDDGKETLNGNTRRNNIYLLTIDGFKGIGANYDPNDPNDPNIPKPENPDEPVTPPVDPPVDKQDTFIRITAQVLPWNVVDRGVVLE